MHGARTRPDAAGGRAPTDVCELLPVGVAYVDRDGVVTYANREWLSLGAPAAGHALRELFDEVDQHRVADALAAAAIAHTTQRVRAPLPDNEQWFELAVAFRPEDGGYGVTLADVTPTVESQRLAEVLEAVFEASPDLVGITDDRFGVVYVNPAARNWLGLGTTAVHNLTTHDIFPAEAFDLYYAEIRPQLVRGESWSGLVPMRNAAGDLIDVWQTVVAGTGSGKNIEWLVSVGREVTATDHAHADLEYRATHDALTSLPNRTLLLDHLRLALGRRDRDARGVGLVFVDLDGFKDLNDRYGHDAGDVALRDIAQRLANATRPSDTVARYGGDEFVVLLDGLGNGITEATQIAERLVDAISAVPVSFGRRVTITASAGVAVAPNALANPQRLITAADRLMYRAKRAGGNRVAAPTTE